MPDERSQSRDAVTTPPSASITCPKCGVVLDALTTTCVSCGAVFTASEGERAERVRAKLQDAIGEGFALGDMLGRGGMGIVFRAREKALERDVALKVLAFDPVLNPEAYDRFEREAKLAARLDHPNIVPIFAVGQHNGVAYYTMRMVRNGNVEQRIVPGRGLPFDEAIGVLRDVSSALDYAHANGVVHRDIKPANILIGDSGHALVADFGIARAFGADTGATGATATGVVGSPAYMSPEQWRGEKVDGKADQYALGILAFELLTGRRPFADAPMQELLRMHLSESPPDIISFRSDLPSRLTDVIWRAMAKEPADRYPSTTAFVDALASDGRTVPMPGDIAATAAERIAAARTTVKHLTPAPNAKTVPTPRAPARAAATRRGARPAREATHRKWPMVALVALVAGLGAVIWTQRARLQQLAGSTGAGAPPTAVAPVAAAPAVVAPPESATALERAQAAENAKLQQEVADARRIALEADKKMEQMLASQRTAAKAAPAAEVHAHLFVMAQGGKPGVYVDGEKMANESPAVIEVKPGRHIVTVEGSGTDYRPAEYSLDLAASDTTNVTFISRAMAQRQVQRQQARLQQQGQSPVDPSTLTPEQKRRYLQQLKKAGDAARAQRP